MIVASSAASGERSGDGFRPVMSSDTRCLLKDGAMTSLPVVLVVVRVAAVAWPRWNVLPFAPWPNMP